MRPRSETKPTKTNRRKMSNQSDIHVAGCRGTNEFRLMKSTLAVFALLVVPALSQEKPAPKPAESAAASAATDFQVYRGTQVPPEVERIYERGLKFLSTS